MKNRRFHKDIVLALTAATLGAAVPREAALDECFERVATQRR